MNISAFKMITGEEVIAEILNIKEQSNKVISYTIKRPHILSFQPVNHGQLGLAFIPWTLSNPNIGSIEILSQHIVCKFDPSHKVEKQYLEHTSGIELGY